jgi:pimeloyl-ACP methyl ester carboxylesterase
MLGVSKRREFCLGLGAGVFGRAVGTAGAADLESGGIPTVRTRGHFDIGFGGVSRQAGVSAISYETGGSIPGLDQGCPDELVVSVHGFQATAPQARGSAREVNRGLSAAGFDGTVVNFSWDADFGFWQWWPTEEIARRNGPKLAAFTRDLLSACPGTRVRYVAHSLGATVVLSALETLARDGSRERVASVSLLGAAVDDDDASLDGQYGADIRSQAGQVDNFRNPNDSVLNWAFGAAEFDGALGSHGIQGPAPRNYEDHAVPGVPSHNAYTDPREGVLDRVVANW